MKHLDEGFLIELIACCIRRRSFFLIINSYLKLNFIPDKGCKELWKAIKVKYSLESKNKISLNVLRQGLKEDESAIERLLEVKDIVKPDFEGTLETFEEFIKESRFVELYETTGEVFNEGDRNKAYSNFIHGAEDLRNFSIKSVLHEKVFGDFERRQIEKLFEIRSNSYDRRIPTGIDLLDHYLGGGVEKGEATLFLGDSGIGKSQLMIHLGISAARRGFKVAHFQAEGKKRQVMDRYDANWTGTLYRDMKTVNIDERKHKILLKRISNIGKGEIFVEAKEKFGSWTMIELRKSLADMFKLYGDIDLVLIDYLELIEPGDGKIYRPNEERFRQQVLGRMIKDIAVEFDVAVTTPTQASAVPPEAKDSTDFVLTRWNLSEDKGKLRPFDNFITLNQTRDEKVNQIIRLYLDKLREHDSGQIITVAQNLARSRFYDRKRTIEEIYTEEELDLVAI